MTHLQKPRVYIAGPITKGELRSNIQRSRHAMAELIRAGFAPLNPMLTCYAESDTPSAHAGFTPDEWYGVDLPWVSVSQAVLRLPGESVGADLETQLAEDMGIPVFESVEELTEYFAERGPYSVEAAEMVAAAEAMDAELEAEPKGDPRFHTLLAEMGKLHAKKASDYGTGEDPFANIRASAEWGIAPWLGALVRANDKVTRLKTYAKTGKLACEGVVDSLMDLSAYSLIALILFQETQGLADSGS